MSNSVFDLISAHQEIAPEGYSFRLDGDLNQMSTQKNFLIKEGFDVKQSSVYPIIKEEDKKKALTLIFENKIQGWHHYFREYIELKICNEKEYRRLLREGADLEKKSEE